MKKTLQLNTAFIIKKRPKHISQTEDEFMTPTVDTFKQFPLTLEDNQNGSNQQHKDDTRVGHHQVRNHQASSFNEKGVADHTE